MLYPCFLNIRSITYYQYSIQYSRVSEARTRSGNCTRLASFSSPYSILKRVFKNKYCESLRKIKVRGKQTLSKRNTIVIHTTGHELSLLFGTALIEWYRVNWSNLKSNFYLLKRKNNYSINLIFKFLLSKFLHRTIFHLRKIMTQCWRILFYGLEYKRRFHCTY